MNVIDYMRWRGDLSFDASPFCEVDNLIFSMLSFIDYSTALGNYGDSADKVLPNVKKLRDCYDEIHDKYPNGEYFGHIIPDETNTLFYLAAHSERFAGVYVSRYKCVYDEAECVQYASVTFILPDDSLFVAFRGTDDTLTGWEEDFRLSYQSPVRSQMLAVEYLNDAAAQHKGKIRTGGHSKGGNLAIYSAAFADREVKERIIMAYSNDGPGFVEDVVRAADFTEMQERMVTIVPQSSVIGMLLERGEHLEIIESSVRNGLLQHNPFTWQVLGREFVHLPALSANGKRHDEVFREWLGHLDSDKRREFTDILFGVLGSNGAKTVSDLFAPASASDLLATLKNLRSLDRDERDVLQNFIRGLLDAMNQYK